MDALLHGGAAKVEQQSNREVQEPEIGQHLLVVKRRELLHRLDFHDDPVVNEQIHRKRALEPFAVDLNRGRVLRDDLQAATLECSGEQSFVDRFEEAWPHQAVQLDRGVVTGGP